ncbi:MAG: hypothetical protein H0T14_08325, partial [Nocardioidaceae bacterium]|nr:hypothetical protein [Nocardioidaceae bacterium]
MSPASAVANPRKSAAAALVDQLRMGSERAGGCVVVAVAAPDAAPKSRELRTLHEAGLAAVPVRDVSALSTVVGRLRPDLVLLDVARCPAPVMELLAELATVGTPAVILYGPLPDPAVRAA